LLILYIIKTRLRYIRNYPKKSLIPSWHLKSWGLSHYDHYLDNLVTYSRHAQSIDENRKNFPRVYWGSRKDYKRMMGQKPAWLKQFWFAGNHSDIGGSYPENESRLSDVSLQWMLDEIKEIPNPVTFNEAMLNLHPMPDGMQHDEIKQKRELWPDFWPKRWRFSWPKEIRKISEFKDLHPSVLKRFELNEVNICGESMQYRPEALKNHKKTKHYYE
jgi:hypothetical protein